MRRLRTSVLLALAASAVAIAPALAGGWATVSVDQGSIAGWRPGMPQDVQVTLLQHGLTPVNDGEVRFTLTNASSGETATGTARSAGDGRWIATLTVPSAGDWALTVSHSGLETTQGGRIPITIGAGAAAAPATPAAAGAGVPAVVLVLLLGVALAAMGAVGVILVARPERGGATRAG